MDSARDFSSNFVLKIEGILDVYQDFYKQKLKQKNCPRHKKGFLEVPYNQTEAFHKRTMLEIEPKPSPKEKVAHCL